MQNRRSSSWGKRLVGLAVVFLASSQLHGESPQAGPQSRGPEPKAPEPARGTTVGPSGYWLGVQCRLVDDALRAHLGLSPLVGLVVEDVFPDSPAAKAGVKRYDVVLSISGKLLTSVGELIDAVEGAKGTELSLELRRGGEKKSVVVRPERRPGTINARPQPSQRGNEPEILRKWLEELQAGEPGASMRFRFFHPGMILPPNAPCHPPVPDNMTVTIVKHGGDPAKITITRDGEKWEVKENELDKLPEELCPFARQMLGRMPAGPEDPVRRFDFIPDWSAGPEDGESQQAAPGAEGDERLDAMIRQLDQLRRALDQMRKPRPRKPAEK
ncbi:MAG: PDZ domain-containing protein [Pirellulales bacterium]|nr:PDZ domain-containing protein [Pirellulales bacterium]